MKFNDFIELCHKIDYTTISKASTKSNTSIKPIGDIVIDERNEYYIVTIYASSSKTYYPQIYYPNALIASGNNKWNRLYKYDKHRNKNPSIEPYYKLTLHFIKEKDINLFGDMDVKWSCTCPFYYYFCMEYNSNDKNNYEAADYAALRQLYNYTPVNKSYKNNNKVNICKHIKAIMCSAGMQDKIIDALSEYTPRESNSIVDINSLIHFSDDMAKSIKAIEDELSDSIENISFKNKLRGFESASKYTKRSLKYRSNNVKSAKVKEIYDKLSIIINSKQNYDDIFEPVKKLINQNIEDPLYKDIQEIIKSNEINPSFINVCNSIQKQISNSDNKYKYDELQQLVNNIKLSDFNYIKKQLANELKNALNVKRLPRWANNLIDNVIKYNKLNNIDDGEKPSVKHIENYVKIIDTFDKFDNINPQLRLINDINKFISSDIKNIHDINMSIYIKYIAYNLNNDFHEITNDITNILDSFTNDNLIYNVYVNNEEIPINVFRELWGNIVEYYDTNKDNIIEYISFVRFNLDNPILKMFASLGFKFDSSEDAKATINKLINMPIIKSGFDTSMINPKMIRPLRSLGRDEKSILDFKNLLCIDDSNNIDEPKMVNAILNRLMTQFRENIKKLPNIDIIESSCSLLFDPSNISQLFDKLSDNAKNQVINGLLLNPSNYNMDLIKNCKSIYDIIKQKDIIPTKLYSILNNIQNLDDVSLTKIKQYYGNIPFKIIKLMWFNIKFNEFVAPSIIPNTPKNTGYDSSIDYDKYGNIKSSTKISKIKNIAKNIDKISSETIPEDMIGFVKRINVLYNMMIDNSYKLNTNDANILNYKDSYFLLYRLKTNESYLYNNLFNNIINAKNENSLDVIKNQYRYILSKYQSSMTMVFMKIIDIILLYSKIKDLSDFLDSIILNTHLNANERKTLIRYYNIFNQLQPPNNILVTRTKINVPNDTNIQFDPIEYTYNSHSKKTYKNESSFLYVYKNNKYTNAAVANARSTIKLTEIINKLNNRDEDYYISTIIDDDKNVAQFKEFINDVNKLYIENKSIFKNGYKAYTDPSFSMTLNKDNIYRFMYILLTGKHPYNEEDVKTNFALKNEINSFLNSLVNKPTNIISYLKDSELQLKNEWIIFIVNHFKLFNDINNKKWLELQFIQSFSQLYNNANLIGNNINGIENGNIKTSDDLRLLFSLLLSEQQKREIDKCIDLFTVDISTILNAENITSYKSANKIIKNLSNILENIKFNDQFMVNGSNNNLTQNIKSLNNFVEEPDNKSNIEEPEEPEIPDNKSNIDNLTILDKIVNGCNILPNQIFGMKYVFKHLYKGKYSRRYPSFVKILYTLKHDKSIRINEFFKNEFNVYSEKVGAYDLLKDLYITNKNFFDLLLGFLNPIINIVNTIKKILTENSISKSVIKIEVLSDDFIMSLLNQLSEFNNDEDYDNYINAAIIKSYELCSQIAQIHKLFNGKYGIGYWEKQFNDGVIESLNNTESLSYRFVKFINKLIQSFNNLQSSVIPTYESELIEKFNLILKRPMIYFSKDSISAKILTMYFKTDRPEPIFVLSEFVNHLTEYQKSLIYNTKSEELFTTISNSIKDDYMNDKSIDEVKSWIIKILKTIINDKSLNNSISNLISDSVMFEYISCSSPNINKTNIKSLMNFVVSNYNKSNNEIINILTRKLMINMFKCFFSRTNTVFKNEIVKSFAERFIRLNSKIQK